MADTPHTLTETPHMLGSTPVLAAGSFLVGTGTTIATAYFRRDPEVSAIGLALMLMGVVVVVGSFVMRALRRVNRPAEIAFDEGYQMGYDKGYIEGRRIGSPTLVTMPARRAVGETFLRR